MYRVSRNPLLHESSFKSNAAHFRKQF